MSLTYSGDNARVSVLLRILILTLNQFVWWNFKKIAEKLLVKQRTTTDIVKTAKNRATNFSNYIEVLACLDPLYSTD